MTPVLAFTVPGPPLPWQRPVLVQGVPRTPRETRAYQRAIAVYALAARQGVRGWPLGARYAVTVRAYFADARRRDTDNVLKTAKDACTRVLWEDDCQVDEDHAYKSVDARHPRLEVEVRVVG